METAHGAMSTRYLARLGMLCTGLGGDEAVGLSGSEEVAVGRRPISASTVYSCVT